MQGNISESALNAILKMQQNELTESYIYEAIAESIKSETNAEVLRRIAQELSHRVFTTEQFAGKGFRQKHYVGMCHIHGISFLQSNSHRLEVE